MISCSPPPPRGSKLTGKRNRGHGGVGGWMMLNIASSGKKKKRVLQAGRLYQQAWDCRGLLKSQGLRAILFLRCRTEVIGSEFWNAPSWIQVSIWGWRHLCLLGIAHVGRLKKENTDNQNKTSSFRFTIKFFIKNDYWFIDLLIFYFFWLLVVGIKPRASHMLGKHYTTKLHLQS